MRDIRTLGPWLRRFLVEYIVTERNLARNTQKSYRDRSNRSISLRHCAAVRRARCLVPFARLMIPLASVWGSGE